MVVFRCHMKLNVSCELSLKKYFIQLKIKIFQISLEKSILLMYCLDVMKEVELQASRNLKYPGPMANTDSLHSVSCDPVA